MSAAKTPTVLERILQSTRAELERRKRELSPQELEYQAFAAGGGGAGGGRGEGLKRARGALRPR